MAPAGQLAVCYCSKSHQSMLTPCHDLTMCFGFSIYKCMCPSGVFPSGNLMYRGRRASIELCRHPALQ